VEFRVEDEVEVEVGVEVRWEEVEEAVDFVAAVAEDVGNPPVEGPGEWMGGVADALGSARQQRENARGGVALDEDCGVVATAEGPAEREEAEVAGRFGFGPKSIRLIFLRLGRV